MKKRSVLAALALTFSGIASFGSALADEKVKSFPAGGAQDILGTREDVAPVGDAGGAIVKKADCRLNSGRIVKAEDADYQKCTEMKGGAGSKGLEKKAKKGEQ